MLYYAVHKKWSDVNLIVRLRKNVSINTIFLPISRLARSCRRSDVPAPSAVVFTVHDRAASRLQADHPHYFYREMVTERRKAVVTVDIPLGKTQIRKEKKKITAL